MNTEKKTLCLHLLIFFLSLGQFTSNFFKETVFLSWHKNIKKVLSTRKFSGIFFYQVNITPPVRFHLSPSIFVSRTTNFWRINKYRVTFMIIQCHLKSEDIKLTNNKTWVKLTKDYIIKYAFFVIYFMTYRNVFFVFWIFLFLRKYKKLPTMQPQTVLSSQSLINITDWWIPKNIVHRFSSCDFPFFESYFYRK